MTVRYTIEAKPTFYNGVQFRSRLEAKWAAFFDVVGRKWSYEPIDFGSWSPDFLLNFECGGVDWFVEIKPITKFDMETALKIMCGSLDSKVMLFGLDSNHCWYWDRISGEWREFPLFAGFDDEEWKQACNIVQWHHS